MVFLLQADFGTVDDDKLIALIGKDEAAYTELISRYIGTVRRIAHLYSFNASDCDDLISEGIVGLLSAVKTYESGRGTSFSTYAYSCVNNRILSALKKSSRIKKCEENIEGLELGESVSPESILFDREELGEVFSIIEKGLSKTEKSVFEEFLSGKSYQEIAKGLSIPLKSVDNALSRVRRKLRTKLR